VILSVTHADWLAELVAGANKERHFQFHVQETRCTKHWRLRWKHTVHGYTYTRQSWQANKFHTQYNAPFKTTSVPIWWHHHYTTTNPTTSTATVASTITNTVTTTITVSKQNKKSPANANGNAQQQCMFERPVKQSLSQLPEGAKRPAAKYL